MDVSPLCYQRSGIGNYVASLLTALRRRRDLTVLPLAHRRLPPTCRIRANSPLWQGWNRTLWMQVRLPGERVLRSADLVHFTNDVSSLLSPCPAVLTIHDMSLFVHPEFHNRKRMLAMRPLVPPAARLARAVITVSEASRQEIIRVLGLPPWKVHAIPLAPARTFRPLSPGTGLERVRARYELPERFVLFVGTIEPRKNIGRLLEAWARLLASRKCPAEAMVVVGQPGWCDRGIYQTARRLRLRSPRLRFLGHLPERDLVALYNLATCLAFPSLYEGFGLPIVEAMACGCPVLTSQTGALAEVAGDAAMCVNPWSVDDIETGLRHILEDSGYRTSLGALGLVRATQFSWDRTAARTADVYKAAANGDVRRLGCAGGDAPGEK